MVVSRLVPIGALAAVVGGVGLLGASLGGIMSVDRELAAAAPSAAGASPVATPVVESRAARAGRAPLRVLRLVDDQGTASLVVVVDRRHARDCGERHAHAGPAV